jgi:16S rRNA (guanine527-N7)-methyltransferase
MENLQPESTPIKEVSRETPLEETLIAKYFPGQEGAIKTFAKFLTGAGIERGLIGPREGDRIWERHIFNCLPVTQLLPKGASLFDIGSGAGLPGIVIALASPDLQVTLIEPLERRVEFLNEAIAAIRTEDYPVAATRPMNSCLDTSKIRQAFGVSLPDWRVGVDKVLEELKQARS